MKHPSQLRYKRPQWSHLRLNDPEYVHADYVYLLLRDIHSAANLAVHGI